MKNRILLILLLLCLLLAGCGAPGKGSGARERIKTIENYVVYYAAGQAEALAGYDLAIIQPDTLTKQELAGLRKAGALSVAYLSVGEVEPERPWYSDGRVDKGWILGTNENWGSEYIDARQPGWQKLMIALTGEYIRKGFDGVFLDTVDTVDLFPETKDGMIALIRALRKAYPNNLLVMNRGFAVAKTVAQDIDAIMFEDLSTTYNFQTGEYGYADNTATAIDMQMLHVTTGLPVLALDYVPPDKPGMAYRAAFIARGYDFIPSASVIMLDQIVDYGLERGGPADLRLAPLRVDGDPNEVELSIQIENVGLSKAENAALSVAINGKEAASQTRSLTIGSVFIWQVPWLEPKEGDLVTVSADLPGDPTPDDNRLEWTFSVSALVMEPLLPYEQQLHRSAPNTPDLEAPAISNVTIDGDLSEWQGRPCYEVNRAEQIGYGDPAQWSGPQDLSGRVCYGWDAENLYVAFQVLDDAIVQKNKGDLLWRGDHVELWFDTQLQLDFDMPIADDDDYQVGISPGDFGQVPADMFIWQPPTPWDNYKDRVKFATLKIEGGYAGEVKLPARVLKGLRLAAGHTIGVSFEPSDTDTPGGSDQELMMALAPNSPGAWGNPTNWNNLTLR